MSKQMTKEELEGDHWAGDFFFVLDVCLWKHGISFFLFFCFFCSVDVLTYSIGVNNNFCNISILFRCPIRSGKCGSETAYTSLRPWNRSSYNRFQCRLHLLFAPRVFLLAHVKMKRPSPLMLSNNIYLESKGSLWCGTPLRPLLLLVHWTNQSF